MTFDIVPDFAPLLVGFVVLCALGVLAMATAVGTTLVPVVARHRALRV